MPRGEDVPLKAWLCHLVYLHAMEETRRTLAGSIKERMMKRYRTLHILKISHTWHFSSMPTAEFENKNLKSNAAVSCASSPFEQIKGRNKRPSVYRIQQIIE